VNLPNTLLPIAALTEKDRADLEAAASIGVDWIALSFVQRPEDVSEARELIAGRAGVMAKIEKPSALLCLEDILKVSDGIMVARGDLGVELPLETVPARQKQLTRAARRAGKPVVVATQMLESMIVEPVPTRAEVSDVATAVYEGADAIMLSAESAAGAWPEKAVATMDKIALSAESDSFYRGIMNAQRNDPQPTTADAISTAARSISETLAVAAIVSYTESGSTAMRVARERPNVPIITLTPIPATARRLALAWGQHCVLTPNANDLEHMIDTACQFASSEGFAEEGQRIIITVGVPLGAPGATNMLRIAQVGKKKVPAA
jgi:pyruvate kinase